MIIDFLQLANNVILKSEFEKLERAYEESYLRCVKYRNTYPRSRWTRQQRAEFNNLMIAFDIAKTDLTQYVSLRNLDSQILYWR